MRVQVKEQLACCVLALILFLAGMCVELPPADTSFLYAKETPSAGITGSVIRNSSEYTMIEQTCTLEMLRCDDTTLLSGNKGQNLLRRFVRTVVALLAVAILLSYLFCLGGAGEMVFTKTVSSQVTIVRYIQQTDGKK